MASREMPAGLAIASITLAMAMALPGYVAARGDARPEATTDATGTRGEEGEVAMESATFGAGCFWGVEEAFRCLPGVERTEVGYAGGHTEAPTYQQVCSHTTGHAEVVQIGYDPEQVGYEELLEVFWRIHDPTQVNRQGPDVGDQYRSVIFYHTEEQREIAEASKRRLDESGRHSRPIATAIQPARTFWRAEEYHQEYLAKHGRGRCPS